MFRKQYDGSQDHDMILRLTAQAERVVHIPKILYFWRSHPQSVAMDVSSKGYAIAAGQNAVRDSLLCMGMDATVESSPAFPTIYRARYALKDTPRVSIVITVRRGASDLKRCIGSIFGVSTYSAFEIVIADGGVQDPALSDYYALLEQHPMIRVFRSGDGNSDAKIKNEAARLATGEYLLFLESDTQVITPAWIEEMLMFAQRADVAAVGAKLYYPNGILHHGGMVLGMGADEIAGTVFHRAPKAADGYMGRLFFAQNYSAVSSACMMMKSDVFWSVNGFDTAFSEAYHDVDLCLRLRKCGQLIVWTPWCEATRYCKKGTDTHPKDAELFRARWQATLAAGDPYYNPNLTLSNSDFRVRSNDENS